MPPNADGRVAVMVGAARPAERASSYPSCRQTLPCGGVCHAGTAHPLGWRAEHQAIGVENEKAPLLRSGEVWIGATLDVMRHGPCSLVHTVSAKVSEVAISPIGARDLNRNTGPLVVHQQPERV